MQQQLARQNTTRKVKNHYQYVILGAGTTAYAAIETIFNRQPDADILLISNEAVRASSTSARWLSHVGPSFDWPLHPPPALV